MMTSQFQIQSSAEEVQTTPPTEAQIFSTRSSSYPRESLGKTEPLPIPLSTISTISTPHPRTTTRTETIILPALKKLRGIRIVVSSNSLGGNSTILRRVLQMRQVGRKKTEKRLKKGVKTNLTKTISLRSLFKRDSMKNLIIWILPTYQLWIPSHRLSIPDGQS